MIDKWIIVGVAHFAGVAAVFKLLGFILPCYVTCCYTNLANVLLFFVVAKFTFELTKSWHLTEKIPPENRAVLITDCGSTLGQKLVKRLDSEGFHVFAGFSKANGDEAKSVREECSRRLQVIPIDVSDDSSVEKAEKHVMENLGTSELWALVNCAEIHRGFEVELTGMDEFRETMEVNVLGAVRVTKAFLPLLRQARGRIVNVTNPAGKLVLPYISPYSMSKFAMMAFNDCLRQELDVWGVRVISVEPFFSRDGLANPEEVKKRIEDMRSKLDPDVRDDYGGQYFRKFQTFVEFLCNSTPQTNDHVVLAIEDAISKEHPDTQYRVSRNVGFRVLNYVLEQGPTPLTHLCMKILLFAAGLPKPQESENYL